MKSGVTDWIVAAMEGASTDNIDTRLVPALKEFKEYRALTKQQLLDMAETYDPKRLTAVVYRQHYESGYGRVIAAKAAPHPNFPEKTALFVKVEPTEKLVQAIKEDPNLFYSIERLPPGLETKRYYLKSLSIVPNPGAQGTQRLGDFFNSTVFTSNPEVVPQFRCPVRLDDFLPGHLYHSVGQKIDQLIHSFSSKGTMPDPTNPNSAEPPKTEAPASTPAAAPPAPAAPSKSFTLASHRRAAPPAPAAPATVPEYVTAQEFVSFKQELLQQFQGLRDALPKTQAAAPAAPSAPAAPANAPGQYVTQDQFAPLHEKLDKISQFMSQSAAQPSTPVAGPSQNVVSNGFGTSTKS